MKTENSMQMYVLYDHPLDCPDCYIARLWEISGARTIPTMVSITADSLEELREKVRGEGFMMKLPRSENDDPVIIESYI